MKIKGFACIFISLALIFCGCSNSGDTSRNNDNEAIPSHIEYYRSSEYEPVTVSADGRVVISKYSNGTSTFYELSEDGSSRNVGSISSIPECMAFMGNELYVLFLRWQSDGSHEGVIIHKIGETENEIVGEYDISIGYRSYMSGNENELYIIAEDKNKPNITCNYPNYWDEKLSVFRIADGKCERLPIDFPTAVCAEQGGGALLAACDDNGFYFVRYKDGNLSEKMYSEDIWYNIDGIADVDGQHILFNMMTSSNTEMLCAVELETMSIAELVPGLNVNGNRIFAANGYCYYQTNEQDTSVKDKFRIERVRFSDYYKYNAPLSFIRSYLSRSTPFSCGYSLKNMQPSNEEAALKILSQDNDYDMCYVSTEDNIAYSIKSQGSFYPLNEISGVSEYLDKCFPAIKEAFTDENGNIWGLPLYLDADFIFSNYGDTDFSVMKLDDFVDYMDGLSSEELDKTLCIQYGFTADILMDYVIKNDSFDTLEFRAAAEKLKNSKRLNMAVGGYTSSTLLNSEKQLMSLYSNSVIENYDRDFKVSGIPCISEANVLIPNVIFLSVNPSSEHLEDALDYIEKLVRYQTTVPNTFVLQENEGVYSESETVKQMLTLCSKADIHFNYPYELYWDDFNKYLAGEISLDAFILEADRKMKVYLNE